MHEALRDGYTETDDALFSEFKAMQAFSMTPDEWYKQDRIMRQYMTGGNVASGALNAMEQHDRMKEAEAKREAESKKHK